MRMRQEVHFTIVSETVTAEEIGTYIGLRPDRIRVRGSRLGNPPRPASHAWEIRCDVPGLRIDEQVAQILDRLGPVEDRLRSIRRDLLGDNGVLRMEFVRMFNAAVGEDEEVSPPEAPLQKLSGQHQLLGWHLKLDVLDFLVRIGAEMWADEYG